MPDAETFIRGNYSLSATDAMKALGFSTDTERLGAKAAPHQHQHINDDTRAFILRLAHNGRLRAILAEYALGEDSGRFGLKGIEFDEAMRVRHGVHSRDVSHGIGQGLGLPESLRELIPALVMERVLQNVDALEQIAERHFGSPSGEHNIKEHIGDGAPYDPLLREVEAALASSK